MVTPFLVLSMVTVHQSVRQECPFIVGCPHVGIPSDGINHQVQDLVIVIPFQSFDQKLDVSHVPVEIPSTHIGRGGVAIAQVEDVDHAHECRSVDGRSTALSFETVGCSGCEPESDLQEQVSIQCWRGRHLVIHAFSQTGTPTVFFCSLACDFRVCRMSTHSVRRVPECTL